MNPAPTTTAFLQLFFFNIIANGDSIIRCADGENTAESYAVNSGNNGGSTACDDQLVISHRMLCAVSCIAENNRFGIYINSYCFFSGVYGCTGQGGKFFRRIYNKLISCFDIAADIIRQPTTRIGNIIAFGIDFDLSRAILTLDFGCGLCSGCNTADNYHFHIDFLTLFLYY